MRQWLFRGLLLSLAAGLLSGGDLDAAGPSGKTAAKKKKSLFTKTVTTTVLTDFLDNNRIFANGGTGPDLGTFDATARFETVTVETKFCGHTICKSTQKTLTVLFESAAAAFEDGTVTDGNIIQLELKSQANGDIPLPPITFANGQAFLKLSTVNGDVVPDVAEGDSMNYDFLFQVTTSNGFGPPEVTVTTTNCK